MTRNLLQYAEECSLRMSAQHVSQQPNRLIAPYFKRRQFYVQSGYWRGRLSKPQLEGGRNRSLHVGQSVALSVTISPQREEAVHCRQQISDGPMCLPPKKVKLCWNQEIDVNILHAYDI